MSTIGFDHIAMPTANAEKLIEFYKRLGFTINDEAEWRGGTAGIFSIQIGDSKINVHPEGYTATLRGPTAVPGCADICFVWDGTAEACQQMYAKNWPTPEWRSSGDLGRVRAPGPAVRFRRSASTPATRTRTFWNG